MPPTLHITTVESMTTRGVWCWTCAAPSAFDSPALVEDDHGDIAVTSVRCCDGCGLVHQLTN